MKLIYQFITILLINLMLPGCALQQWNKDHSTQIKQTAGIVLKQAARDAVEITVSALANQATTGFNGDWGNSFAQGTYQNLPSIVNTSDVDAIAKVWNPAAPGVNQQLSDKINQYATAASAAGQKDPTNVKAVATAVAVAVQATSNGVPKDKAIAQAVTAAQNVIASNNKNVVAGK